MDKLKIAFYIGKSRENPRVRLWDKFVCFVDGSVYSHAELVLQEFPDGTCLCASSSARDGGVRFKRIQLNPNHWVLVDIYGDKDYAERWMSDRLGRGYDWLGLARTKLRWTPDSQTRYFCTEAVAEMLGLEDAASYGPRLLFKVATTKLNKPWVERNLSDIDVSDPH